MVTPPPTFGTFPQIKSSFSLGAWFIDLKLLERRRTSIMKKTTHSCFSPFGGVLFKLMKWKYWPRLSCEQWTIHIYISMGAHSSSERSQTIRGHFLKPRSDAKTRRRISPPRKMICTVLCIRCQGKSLPSFEDANGIEFFTRLWQEAELNWQSKLMLYWSNTPNPWRHEDILKKNINWSCFWRFLHT